MSIAEKMSPAQQTQDLQDL